MNRNEYILANAGLPLTLGVDDSDALTLLNAAPTPLWLALADVINHEQEVEALDELAAWIESNWRTVLPVISARFPDYSKTARTSADFQPALPDYSQTARAARLLPDGPRCPITPRRPALPDYSQTARAALEHQD